ncbi:MAG: O-methyltransferase [Chitinophagales bacterium]|nr:O-methyltransferase [Chitinophagales bacterium]
MHLLPAEVEKYIEDHSKKEEEQLYDLNRETHLKIMNPQMIAGHVQGKFLQMISSMVKPARVLEIGTFTGYSAICFACGLQEQGEIYTIEFNEELRPMIEDQFDKAGLSDKIHLHIGDAAEVIPTLDGPFDIVYIDADKINYHRYFDLSFPLVPVGGYIISDNVLWSGKVAQAQKDKETKALDDYNKKLVNDPRIDNVLISVRDGIMIARKIAQ